MSQINLGAVVKREEIGVRNEIRAPSAAVSVSRFRGNGGGACRGRFSDPGSEDVPPAKPLLARASPSS